MSATPITKWKNDRSNARLTRGVFSRAEPELLIVSIEFHPSQLSMAEENGDMTFETIAYLEDSSYEQHAIISTNSKIPLSVGR